MPIFKAISKSPIRKNILANFYGIGVNLLNQIVLVPLYIVFWGNDLYSDWIVISALTVIFSMSDIGLNNVIQNRFSMKFAERDIKECKSLLANNLLIVTSIFALAILITLCCLTIFDIVDLMGLHSLKRLEASAIFLLLVCRVFLGMYSGIENAIYRANHQASRAVYMDQTCTLCTVLITIACLYLQVNIAYMCICFCIPYIMLIFIKRFDAKKYFSYGISVSDINFKSLKSLFIPSVSFMSFPLGYAIIMQGFTLIVNKFFGADNVVLYNTTRTVCNFLKVVPNAIKNATWPEFTIAYAKKNIERMKNLYRKTIFLSLAFVLFAAIILLVGGDSIYQIWTQKAVGFSFSLMFVYMTSIFFNSIWETSGMALMATNKHTKLGILFVCLSALSFLLAMSIAPYINNLIPIVLCILLVDISLSIYAIQNSWKVMC